MLRVMERRNFPVASLRLLASPRSAGKTLIFRGEELTVEPLHLNSFEGIDIALFSAGGAISRDFAHAAVTSGAVVVDNSSAFRMSHDVPLVVPEINGADVKNHRGIIANPNCTTAITLMALHPLHRAFGVTRLFASSYQAVSGAGARAIDELQNRELKERVAHAKEVSDARGLALNGGQCDRPAFGGMVQQLRRLQLQKKMLVLRLEGANADSF